jgi:4-hydroxy-tetrahydrodipicolinate reductase
MVDVVVCGVAGRMGQRLAILSVESDDLNIAGGTEHVGHAVIGKDIGEAIGKGALGLTVTDDLAAIVQAGQVVLNFTVPEATLEAAMVCAAKGVPMVVGTTGWKGAELDRFKSTVASIPCVFASNFSTAMNVLFKLVEEAARILGDDYDVEIVEAHHHDKVDAPSGSALSLGERAAAGLGRDLKEVVVHGRQGVVGARTQQEIGMHALRVGDVAGIHTVMFGAAGEFIELRHTATSRDAFALGALRAVRFAATAPTGLYDMGDVLGIK